MIRIQRLNRQELAEFIRSETYKTLPDLPISAHRAAAQLLNPRLDETHTLLILAWLDGELVGYMGILPDLYFKGQQPAACGWLTCIWVSDRHRGKSIGKQLVASGLEEIDGKVLVTDFAPQSKQLIYSLGYFDDLQVRQGIRLYFRLDLHRLLPPRKKIFEHLKPLLRLADASANLLIDMKALLFPPRKPGGNWDYVEAVTPEIRDFIAEKQGRELFRRNMPELNWALNNPWILSAPLDEDSRRYYFSSVDRSFDFVCLTLRDAQDQLQAFLILAKRRRTLKMPCCYLAEGLEHEVARLIHWHIHEWGINTFSTFHTEMLRYYRTNRTFALYKKELKRQFPASKKMAADLAGQSFEIQDGDGDCFFT